LSGLESLPALTSLDVSDNQLTSLSGLESLPALTSLDVRSNQLTSLSGLESLPALTSLDVSDNQLTSLSGLESLPALTSLDVSDNQLTSLSDIPASFTLRVLSANKNKLTSFRQLPDLPLLQRLYIRGNKIADWQGLSRFTHLLHLVAGQNDFSELADFPLLPRLRSLDLRGCSVAELRPLAQLPDLQNLVADDCPKLKNIACLPDFPELVGVSLQHNTFDAIKPLHNCAHLALVFAHNLAAKDVPLALLGDMWDNCFDYLRLWWQETADPGQCVPNKTVKIMLTGNGNAGKSTLAYALRHGACPEDTEMKSTHGIQIETLEDSENEINYHLWDFGGQEIYHGTHRMFMSSPALQVLVFDPLTEARARRGETADDRLRYKEQNRDHRAEYWLGAAREQSPRSRFLLIQNKKDFVPGGEIEDTTLKKLAREEDIGFHHLSARVGGRPIRMLKDALAGEAEHLNEYLMLMPASWIAVRDYLLNNQTLPPEDPRRLRRLTQDEYEALCIKHEVSKYAQQALLQFLHHSGVVYHSNRLKEYPIIVDQRWALDAIYTPLNRESDFYEDMREHHLGKTSARKLFRAFDAGGQTYTLDEKWFFLSFMESCGLCFRLNEEDKPGETEEATYIFPEFLSDRMSETAHRYLQIHADKALHHWRLKLPYLGYHRLQSFIVALGRKTMLEYVWRNGILFFTPNGAIIVESRLETSDGAYVVVRMAESAGHWIKTVVEVLEENGITYSPVGADNPGWMFSVNDQDFEPRDPQAVPNRIFADEHPQSSSFNAAPTYKEIQEPDIKELKEVPQQRPPHLVISYAKENRWAVEAFIRHLRPIMSSNKLTVFWDNHLDSRRPWKDELEEEFKKADGYVVFASAYYTDYEEKRYIHNEELPIMRARQKEGTPVYCITVTAVDYEYFLEDFLYYKDKLPIPTEESAKETFLYDFVQEVIKKKLLVNK